MELLIFIVLISSLLCGSEKPTNPQKVQLGEDVLDRLAEIDGIYQGFLTQGMTPARAAAAALKWQEDRYPTIMYPLRETDYKDELDKGGRKEKKSKKDEK